jgi:hypothetical protein
MCGGRGGEVCRTTSAKPPASLVCSVFYLSFFPHTTRGPYSVAYIYILHAMLHAPLWRRLVDAAGVGGGRWLVDALRATGPRPRLSERQAQACPTAHSPQSHNTLFLLCIYTGGSTEGPNITRHTSSGSCLDHPCAAEAPHLHFWLIV